MAQIGVESTESGEGTTAPQMILIKGFQTIVFIFVISTMFWLCPLAFFRCLSNSGTYTELWLTKSEQVTPMDSINDVVQSSMWVPEFEKHLKAGGHIGQNVVEITTIKMKTLVQKPLMIKIIKFVLEILTTQMIHTKTWIDER